MLEIVPERFGDHRGFFSETWNKARFLEAWIDIEWIQENHSLSEEGHVLRGLHYQIPPFAQDKLVRVVSGAVFDVVVDIRQGSPNYGRWASIKLSVDEWNRILVPKGFAHGFLTLEPGTEVIYMVSAPYSSQHERSIRFDDPQIAVEWPLGGVKPVLSGKDEEAPFLANVDTGFHFIAGEGVGGAER